MRQASISTLVPMMLVKKDARIFDRTVNMRFCCKVDYDVRMFFFKQLIHCFAVADVGLYEAKFGLSTTGAAYWTDCLHRQLVKQMIGNPDTSSTYEHKVTTNKTSTASNNNIHSLLPRLLKNNSIFCHSSQMFAIWRFS